tara:strand:- start:3578 stop:4543 length:966 start_codon:yes stop_codon:yes gene_type:complete
MIDLSDCTFIIPLKIDSPEREKNIELVLAYLTSNFITTIVVTEADEYSKFDKKIKKFENLGVYYDFIELQPGDLFHRTHYLNEMLAGVSSPITINYDADIILPLESYVSARNMIRDEYYDLVYPFEKSSESQMNIDIPDLFPIENIIASNFTDFGNSKQGYSQTGYGCCQFFNTDSYRNGFMENESFISWGPEDYERFYRFDKLGYKIGRTGSVVVHFEHPRDGKDGRSNPFLNSNINLYDALRLLDKESMITWFIKRDWLHRAIIRNGRENFSKPWFNRIKMVEESFTKNVVKRHIKIDGSWKEYKKEILEFGEKNHDDV